MVGMKMVPNKALLLLASVTGTQTCGRFAIFAYTLVLQS